MFIIHSYIHININIIINVNAVLGLLNCYCSISSRLGRADRPLGVFLLLGGSGVGKTELAKRVSQQLFPIGGGDRESVEEEPRGAMLRIDMSEVKNIVNAVLYRVL